MRDQIWDDLLYHPCEHVRRDAAKKLGQRWAEETLKELERRIKRIK